MTSDIVSALPNCSGARNRNSTASPSTTVSARSRAALLCAELIRIASPASTSKIARTWSRRRAISGEITTVSPGISDPAIR